MYRIFTALAVICLVMTGQGCSAFNRPIPPQLPQLPQTLAAAPESSELKITSTLLEMVDDARAESLVDEALKNNHDLRATALRLKSSGLLLTRTVAAMLPEVDAGYRATRNNQYADNHARSRHRVSLSFSWELDVWGKLADRHEARKLDYQALELDYHRAMDSLAARVLQAYFTVKANQLRLGIDEKRVVINGRIEATVLSKYKAGLGTLDDISAARTKTHLARSNLTDARDIHASSVRDLEVLLGRYPGAAIELSDRLPDIALPRPGVPASILANRPDVQAAREKFESAWSDARASHKEMLPGITLSGDILRDHAKLGKLDSASTAWGLVGSILLPVFNASRLKNEALASDARAQAAYEVFTGTVVRAMKEAENAFSKEDYLKQRLIHLEEAMKNARQSSRYYESRFKEGLTTIVELHTARDQELSVMSGIVDVKTARIVNRVDMALALGTGAFERNEK